MTKGLSVLKNKNNKIILDSDNLFWGIINNNCTDNKDFIIPQRILTLYEKTKDKLDTQINDFRFSQELSAIYIDPTDRCNANCPYCYIPQEIKKSGYSMNKKELFFILEKIIKYFDRNDNRKKPVIVFHASEPLLVKKIIFEAMKKYDKVLKFGLQTNAILLEKNDVEFLKKYRVGVGISLDSSSSITNNRLRRSWQGGGNFKKAIKAIDWFGGYEGLNIITTVTKFNVRDLPKLVKFLHGKKVPCVLFNPVRLTQKNSHILKPNEKILTKYFIKAVDKAIELSTHSKHRIIVGNFSNIILGIVAPTSRRLMCDISPCGGGRCFLTITASGEMIPCGEFIGLKKFSGGNIFSAKGGNSIEKAMKSHPFKKIRARFVEKISECKECTFRNICGAPCPAELYALGNMYPARSRYLWCGSRKKRLTFNGMYRKSIFCEFYKQIIKYAFKIIAERKEKYCFRNSRLSNLKYEYILKN